jgi:hypothetical protein
VAGKLACRDVAAPGLGGNSKGGKTASGKSVLASPATQLDAFFGIRKDSGTVMKYCHGVGSLRQRQLFSFSPSRYRGGRRLPTHD